MLIINLAITTHNVNKWSSGEPSFSFPLLNDFGTRNNNPWRLSGLQLTAVDVTTRLCQRLITNSLRSTNRHTIHHHHGFCELNIGRNL